MPLQVGSVLNNRYRIVKLLGQGGFGAVYRAWDINMERPRALKENLDTSPESQRQFKLEAQILGDLTHPNLPKVIDHFILPGQGQYLVMEFVDGEDLNQILERSGGPISEAQALPWISQVCDALNYLHSHNPPVIHRDIKPANIKIDSQGRAILVDFGIAKVYDPSLRTTMGARAVTPGYSPNEQYLSNGRTDARTDIYALGATLYTLFTCQTPPEAPERNMGVALPSIRSLNSSISPQTETAILQAMNMQPGDRWQNAAGFKDALILGLSTFGRGAGAKGSLQPVVSSGQFPIGGVHAKPAPGTNQYFHISNLKWLAIPIVVFLAVSVLWALTRSSGQRNALAVTQTALVEVIEKATVDAQPTRTRAPSDTPEATWTTAPSDTPLPSSTPLPTETALPTYTSVVVADMVLIPAGEFLMGPAKGDSDASSDEKPQHRVMLDEYFIDIYEVTNALFKEFVLATGYRTTAEKLGTGYAYTGSGWEWVKGADWQHPQGPSSGLDGLADHPVEYVSWDDAKAYCEWRGASLPTEAQWEKAARGGLEEKKYPWGNDAPVCQKGARNGVQFWDCALYETVAVGSFGPNGYGLYDMAGNLWEWVQDWYQADFYANSPSINPIGPSSGDNRVVRGGSWSGGTWSLRIADRIKVGSSYRVDDVGFRCARSRAPE